MDVLILIYVIGFLIYAVGAGVFLYSKLRRDPLLQPYRFYLSLGAFLIFPIGLIALVLKRIGLMDDSGALWYAMLVFIFLADMTSMAVRAQTDLALKTKVDGPNGLVCEVQENAAHTIVYGAWCKHSKVGVERE